MRGTYMKNKIKIFRWSESRNTSVILTGVFNPNKKATFASIEMERRSRDKEKRSFV